MSRRLMSGNKGVFFSLIAILILVLLAMEFAGRQKLVIESESETIQTQFEIANNFVNDLQTAILPRLLEADVGVALNAFAIHINNTRFAKDTPEDETWLSSDELARLINETVLNGTKGPATQDIRDYVGNSTLPFQIVHLGALADEQLHMTVTIVPSNVSISQDNDTGPYKVRASMNARLSLDAGFAKWDRMLENITTLVDINGLLDPYLMVKAEGLSGTIRFYNGPFTNATLQGMLLNRTYTGEKEAPSFLGRFSGDLSASECCGIETIVAINGNLPPTVDYLYRSSMIDWCYWSGECPRITTGLSDLDVRKAFWLLESSVDSTQPIIASRGKNSPFYSLYLDAYHLDKYNLSDYRIEANACACNEAQLPKPMFNGPGCVGDPDPLFGDEC